MSQALFWLALTVLMTACFWIIYVLNSFAVRGIVGTLANPSSDQKPLAAWAIRAKNAHVNAVENLIPFTAMVLIAAVAQLSMAAIASAAMVYFFARLGHFIVYTAGIPGLRTLCFLTGFGSQLFIAIKVLGQLMV